MAFEQFNFFQMIQYKAKEDFIQILLRKEFIETTCERDFIKGKKEFRLSKNSPKKIYFDYDNIQVWNSVWGQDSKESLSVDDLKSLLIYFKMNSNDYKEFDKENSFSFDNINKRIVEMKKELELLRQFDRKESRRNRLDRILKTYEMVLD